MAVIVRKKGRRKGPEPAYAALHRVADRNVARLARQIVTAMRQLRGRFTVDEWAYAISTGTWSVLLARFDEVTFTKAIDPAELEPITGQILDIAIGAAKASVTWQGLTGAQQATLLSSLSVVNPQAVAWARQYAASLVGGILEQNRLAIRQIISDAMGRGGHPYDTAKLIQHTIGLAPNQVRAVGNYRQGLLAAIDNGGTPAGLRSQWGLSPVRYPGQLQADRVEEFVARYADKQLVWRARNIARTETMTAANGGQQMLWEQMVDAGYLSPDVQKVFIVTDDDALCEECASYDGQVVEVVGGAFSSDLSDGDVEQPPVHPNCRCTTGLSEEPTVDANADAAQPEPPVDAQGDDPVQQAVDLYGGSLGALQDALSIEGAIDDPDIAAHLQALSTMPEHLHQMLADNGVSVVVGTKPIPELDEMSALAGVQPRGWADGKTWDVVDGAYDPQSKQILLGGGGQGVSDFAAHEYGHAVDYTMGTLSHGSEWEGIWHNAYHDIVNPYFLQNNTWGGAEEFFAETFSRVVQGGDHVTDMLRASPRRLDQTMQVKAFMRKLLAPPAP